MQSEAATFGLTTAANALNLPPIQVGQKLQSILNQADADAQAIQGTTLNRIVDAITVSYTHLTLPTIYSV